MIQLLLDNPGLKTNKKEGVKHKYQDLFDFSDDIEVSTILTLGKFNV